MLNRRRLAQTFHLRSAIKAQARRRLAQTFPFRSAIWEWVAQAPPLALRLSRNEKLSAGADLSFQVCDSGVQGRVKAGDPSSGAPAGAAPRNREVVGDESAATAGEDRRATGEACAPAGADLSFQVCDSGVQGRVKATDPSSGAKHRSSDRRANWTTATGRARKPNAARRDFRACSSTLPGASFRYTH